MIFIGFFLFIAVVVIALNMYNSSNLSQIEDYIKGENCKQYLYSKGSYKAICENRILEIPNAFSIDIQKDLIEYRYEDIKTININKLDIVINDNSKISFKKQEELDSFYKQINTKLKK